MMQKIHESTEMLTVYDQNLNPIGTRTREYVHNNGLLHQTVRLWCIQNNQIWFQRRSESKKLFPGRLDLAATGHIDPGETPLQAVIRETKEEISIQDYERLIQTEPEKFCCPNQKEWDIIKRLTGIYLNKSRTTDDMPDIISQEAGQKTDQKEPIL